jgi:regulatory protein PHO2
MSRHEPYPILDMRFNRASLRFDATAVVRKSDEDHSSDGSPTSAITSCSPTTTSFDNHQSPQELDRVKSEDERELVSGPIRSQSGSSAKSDKEKRKRSRVTQEQLVHLERYFKADHNPTATRRREISEQLGMQERQTQIWFQNR